MSDSDGPSAPSDPFPPHAPDSAHGDPLSRSAGIDHRFGGRSAAGANPQTPPAGYGNEDADKAAAARELPHNIEAEQGLLGAILINNETLQRVADILKPEHFFDPLHQRIYEVLDRIISRGKLANPITLKSHFENDPRLADIGGTSYLANLAAAAPTIVNAPDYARIIFELFQRRGLIMIGQDMVNAATDTSLDVPPSEQIEDAEQHLYSLAESGTYEGGFVDFHVAAGRAVEIANEAQQNEGGLSGITTGFVDLDKQLGGLHRSDLIILAGRPSMGKTALATNIAFNAARKRRVEPGPDGIDRTVEGALVAFYSLEMSSEQLAMRILSEQSRVSSHRLRKGDVDPEEFRDFLEAQRELQNLPLYVDETGGISIAALSARARRLQRRVGLDLIVVDYLQLVTSSSRNDGRVQEVSEVTQGLKALAKELHVPVLALSQLSRKVEDRDDKRPQLADLRESGSIEQDADVVMFVFREEYYVERRKPHESDKAFEKWEEDYDRTHGLAEVIIGKQRHGPTGTIELTFQAEFTRFGNKEYRDYPID